MSYLFLRRTCIKMQKKMQKNEALGQNQECTKMPKKCKLHLSPPPAIKCRIFIFMGEGEFTSVEILPGKIFCLQTKKKKRVGVKILLG